MPAILGQFVERFADGEKLVVMGWRGKVSVLKVHPMLAAAMAGGALAAGALDENPAHGLGGSAKKVRLFNPPS